MSTLRRTSRTLTIPGTRPVPPELPWVEYIADDDKIPALPATRVKSIFPWAASKSDGSVPTSGSSSSTSAATGGGSMSELGGYYTQASYNGVPGTYVVTKRPDGSYTVVRV